MGLWPCVPALLAVWSCLATSGVFSYPTVIDRIQSAAPAPVGTELTRLRRSRHSRQGVVGGPSLETATAPPPFQTVSHLGSTMIECKFQGSPPPSIDWLKDGQMLRKAGLVESIEEQSNNLDALMTEPSQAIVATRARLYLDCVTHRDQGVYACQGQTPYSTKSEETWLLVDDPVSEKGMDVCERVKDMRVVPARVIQWRSHLLARMGDQVRLVCETSGYPAPRVTWHRDGSQITSDDPRKTVMPNGDLVIDALKWSDMGMYHCSASNEFGSDEVTSFLYPYKPEN